MRKHPFGKSFDWVRAALCGAVVLLAVSPSGPSLAAPSDHKSSSRDEVSDKDRDEAAREANKGWEKAGKGDSRAALDHYIAALELDPDNRAAREGLGGLLGIPALAAPAGGQAGSPAESPTFPVTKKQRQEAAKQVGRGWKKARQGDSHDALESYLEALGLDPHNRAARDGVVELLAARGPLPAAPAAVRPAVAPSAASGPRSPRDAQVLGRISDGPQGPLDPKGPHYGLAKPYLSRVEHSADHYGVEPRLVLAVIMVESGFSAHARSSSGARGLMQLLPATASKFGAVNADDPFENIDAGTRYLRYLLDLFNGDVDRALAAYNAGEMTVVNARGVPTNSEVQRFVHDVKAYYRQF